jgi:arsenical pump membrane protein
MTKAKKTASGLGKALGIVFFQLAANAAIAGAGAILYIYYSQDGGTAAHQGWRIIILAITTIAFIVLPPRFGFERWIEDKGWPGREAWASLIALAIALSQGLVTQQRAYTVAADKIDIIAFILSFAILAEGLARAGYIQYAAYYIVRKCAGDTARLVLYLYILTSIFTFLTSNDIVTLVMTPIIIAVSIQAGIKNPRLLLLSQFVAANTLAMGLIIGSPTNIIIGQILNLDFFRYMFMMLIPSLYAFFLSFAVVDFLNRSSSDVKEQGRLTRGIFSWLGTKKWEFEPNYQVPHIEKYSHFTQDMKEWVWLFGVKVFLVGLVTYYRASLFWVAVPTAALSLGLYYYQARGFKSKVSRIASTLKLIYSAPFGIFFFGMTFFILANALVSTSFFTEVIIPEVQRISQQDLGLSGMIMIFLSGISVNLFNDLPAAALIGEVFDKAQIASPYAKHLMLQGILVGVNIGCYVTPVGALAGLIWFHRMAREKRHHAAEYAKERKHGGEYSGAALIDPAGLELPSRGDMIHYGLLHFIMVGASLGVLLPFGALVLDFLLEPVKNSPPHPDLAGRFPNQEWFWWLGLAITAASIAWFRRVLTAYQILLSHLKGVFLWIVHAQIWAVKNRLSFMLVMLVLIFGSISALLYLTEKTSAGIYHRELPFDSIQTFILWFFVWVGGSFEQGLFPLSVGGHLLVAFLPASLLGLLIFIFRSATSVRAQEVSARLASGEMPHYRTVILNFDPALSGFLSQLLRHGHSFVVILCRHYHVERTQALVNTLLPADQVFERTFVAPLNASPDLIASRYNVADAEEIFLLDDGSDEGALGNLRHLALIDLTARKAAGSVPAANGIGEDGAWYYEPDERDLGRVRLPHVVLEVPNDRMGELLKRTVSRAFEKRIKQVRMHVEVAKFLKADARSDLTEINKFYRFDDGLSSTQRQDLQDQARAALRKGNTRILDGQLPPPLEELSEHRENLAKDERLVCTRALAAPDTGWAYSDRFVTDGLRLNEYKMTEAGQKALRALFSSLHEKEDPDGKENAFIRERAMRIRVNLVSRLRDQIHCEAGKNIRIGEMYGIGIRCDEARTRLSVGSVSMSGKTKMADAVIALEDRDGGAPRPLDSKRARIVVINVNPTAEVFIQELAPKGPKTENDHDILVVAVGEGTRFIPRSVMTLDREEKIDVVPVPGGYRAIADLLTPLSKDPKKTETVSKNGRFVDARLKRGDFIYVFLKQGATPEENEAMSDELYSVEVINRLMDRISQQRERNILSNGKVFERTDFYIAAEINNAETRFLFENLYVDDIFDTSWIRKSYFENLARAYYGPQADRALKHAFKRDSDDFNRAHGIAALLGRYIVHRAGDLKLTDERGLDRHVAGRPYREARALIRNYSDPPMQLVGTGRLELNMHNRVCLVPSLAQHGDSEKPIGEDDLLINIPII